MSHGRFVPPEHDKGDANTIGGYHAVHARPAAFEGPDGFSYSVEIVADETGEADLPWGAYLLFVRWHRTGEQTPAGHLETAYLSRGAAEAEVLADLSRLPLLAVKELLDACVIAAAAGDAVAIPARRRWWDAMRNEAGEENPLPPNARPAGRSLPRMPGGDA